MADGHDLQEEVYEDHCTRTGMSTDQPISHFQERLRAFQHSRSSQPRDRVRLCARLCA